MRNAIAVALLFLSVSVSAATITSLSPSSINVGSGEWFLTVTGTGFTGNDEFIFDGPAGHFELAVNAIDSSGRIIGWIPQEVVNDSGSYAFSVRTGLSESERVTFTVGKPSRLPLQLHLPELLAVLARSALGTGVKYDVTTTGGDGSAISIKCDPESGSLFPFGRSSIYCQASNLGGERDEARVDVVVWDGTAPELTLPESFEVPADDEKGAYVKFDVYAKDDIDGELRVTCDHESGSVFPNGRTAVRCETVDSSLNPASGSFDVFVRPEDIGRLELRTQGDIKIEATDEYGAWVKYEISVFGSADPDPVVDCTPASDTFFQIGEHKVYCVATDDFGGRAEDGFIVSVYKGSGLRMEDVSAEATSPNGAEVTFEPEAVDERWTADIVCSPKSGSVFALGETAVDCESTDASGKRATGSFKVTVADTTAPYIEKVRAVVGGVDAARGVAPVDIEIQTIDAGDAVPRCSVTALSGESPVEWTAKTDLAFEIRAEAAAPRSLRAQVTCADSSGNQATINVPLSIGAVRRRAGRVQ
jgi:hypothetical protein